MIQNTLRSARLLPTEAGTGTVGPDLSIVIVNWNSADFVRKCLESVDKHTSGLRFEVIVVDSASFDGCGEMLAREYPGAVFIQSQENIGFGRANNLGGLAARGRHLLLLNPDTELRENSLLTLVRRLETLPRAGAVGCKLLNADGSLQTACVQSFPTIFNQVLDAEFLRRRYPRWSIWGTTALHSSDPQPAVVEAVSGACILVRKEVFDLVGGFSPCYFMYGEDLDLCFKIKQAGYAVYHVPQTSLVHYGGGCTGKNASHFPNVMMRESVYRFLRRNRGAVTAVTYRAALAVASLVRLAFIVPLLLLSRHRVVQHGTGSLGKWAAIFRWCVGLQGRAVAHAGSSFIEPPTGAAAVVPKS